jgi:hypothetical protein
MSNGSRRDFLKASLLAGMGASLAELGAGCAAAPTPAAAASVPGRLSSNYTETRSRPSGQKPVNTLTTSPLEKVRVAVIGLNRGLTHVASCQGIEFSEVVAVCDIRDDRAKRAADLCEKKSGKRPAIYSGNENIWEQMVDRDDIDAVYIDAGKLLLRRERTFRPESGPAGSLRQIDACRVRLHP